MPIFELPVELIDLYGLLEAGRVGWLDTGMGGATLVVVLLFLVRHVGRSLSGRGGGKRVGVRD